MARSYFIFKNIDSRDKGVTLAAPAPIVRGEERVSHVTIPGKAGELTLAEGDDVYESYIQTITMSVKGAANVRDVYDWLRGTGYVIFSGEPDRRQQARVIGAVTLTRLSRNLDIWNGEVQFYCHPLKELLNPTDTTRTSTGTVTNAGDVTSYPLITATASAATMVITMGGKMLTITGLTSGSKYIVDSAAQMVTNEAGTTVLTANTSGGFPVLAPGDNTATGSGWSRLVIDRRERFL